MEWRWVVERRFSLDFFFLRFWGAIPHRKVLTTERPTCLRKIGYLIQTWIPFNSRYSEYHVTVIVKTSTSSFLSAKTILTVCNPLWFLQPMKFITTRWRMTLAKTKSANALSGEIPLKSERFAGLDCTRRQTEIKKPQQLEIQKVTKYEQSLLTPDPRVQSKNNMTRVWARPRHCANPALQLELSL